MQSIDSAMNNLLSKLDVNQAKALRIAQNNQLFECAIRHTWNDNPSAAEYVLAHTNGIYFKKDEHPRKGTQKNKDCYVLGIYLDDSLAKSELNARREMLLLMLAQEGIRIDEIVLHSATWGMRERHLFPHAIQNIQQTLNSPCSQVNTADNNASIHGSLHIPQEKNLAAKDQSHMLEVFKRACCLAFEDYEQAWLLLSQIEGAELTVKNWHTRCRSAHACYWCTVYVASPDKINPVLHEYKSAIMSKAQDLGLKLHDIQVLQSRPEMNGVQVFPRQGAPRVLYERDPYLE